MAMMTLGGWHKTARDYIKQAALSVAADAQLPAPFAITITFQRLAARLVQLNANCLAEGLQAIQHDFVA